MVVKVIDSPNNQAAKSALYCSIRNFEMLSITGRAEKLEVLSLYLKIGFGELGEALRARLRYRTKAEKSSHYIKFTYSLEKLFKTLLIDNYSYFSAH